MEIKKESINLTEMNVKMNSNVLVEGDIIIPDTNPDMKEVLIADAKAQVESVEYRNGKLNVSGTVFMKVLYKPDETQDDAELKALDASLPFSDTLDISSGENLKYFVSSLVEHIGFTLINSRKLSVKVVVSLLARGYRECMIEPVSSISGEGVECRNKKYNIHIPLLDEETNITLSDVLTVPENMPDIDEILKVDGLCRGAETKIMNGKVMVRGELLLKTLYSAAKEGERTQLVCHEIPFAEIVEAEKVPKANKLLKFAVKIGDETRTIVSGIAKFYTPEEMLGKQVVVVSNLKPAKLCGIESQGMLLCACTDDDLVIVSPEKKMPSGATVR